MMQRPDNDPNADTEWNDILRSKGILPAKEEATITEEEIISLVDSVAQKHADFERPLEDATLQELDELDELDAMLEDDRALQYYRRKRLQEMQEIAQRSKFGALNNISKVDWNREVTESSKENPVIVLLHKDPIPMSKSLFMKMNILAKKYPASKFVWIVSDQCIEKYPDVLVPTVIVYVEGDVVRRWTAEDLTRLGVDRLEKELERCGAVQDLYAGVVGSSTTRTTSQHNGKNESDQDSDEDGGRPRFSIRNVGKDTRRNMESDDDWD